jgi:succinoglycan biosynthesis transport protein ExoP
MQEHEGRTVDLRAYVKAIWRRRWLLIIPALVGGLTGFVIAESLPPVYEAKSTVVVRVQDRLSEPLAQLVGPSPMEEQLSRLQEKVTSTTFLVELVRTLHMADDPAIRAWAKKAQQKQPETSEDQLAEGRAVRFLQDRIAVVRTTETAFQVLVRDLDPDRATLLAQHITNAIINASSREQLEDIRAVHDFSVEQLVVYKQKLDDAEDRLKQFQGRRATRGAAAANPVSSQNLNRVDILTSQAMVDETSATERLESKRRALASVAAAEYEALRNLSTATLEADGSALVSLERQVASVLVRTTEEGSEVTSLYVSTAAKKDQLRENARKAAVDAVPGASRAVQDAFAEYKVAGVELQMIQERKSALSRYTWDYARGRATATQDDLEYSRLLQEVESNRALYDAFLQQSAAGQISEALDAAKAGGRFEIVEPPTRPMSPVAPDKPMILILSLLGGLVVGLGAVLISEQGDTSFKDIEDIERTLGAPVLAAVPEAEVLGAVASRERRNKRPAGQLAGESALIAFMMRETPVSFEFRRMARKLAKVGKGSLPRSILVTSAHRGEGKTTTAACLSIVLAQRYGKKTVLVDCDLRKPRVHQIMEVEQRPGLSDALERGNLLGTDLKPTGLPSLTVLPCGSRRERQTGVLEWFAGSRVMEELLARFDVVIIDTAPNVAVPDAILIGSEVDCVVMVVKAGSTPREVVKRGLQLQTEEKANVVGLVVNNFERVLPYYYDYKYYHSGPSDEEEEQKGS